MAQQNPSPMLTEEIIMYESLSKLPVQTILPLRSVCKVWSSLTSNPNFIRTQLSKSTHDNIFSWLPKSLVYNIFSRLNVKDLSRIKSVCKPWLSLISRPDFVMTHLEISSNDPKFKHHGLILCDAPFLNHEFRPYVDFTVRGHGLRLKGCSVDCLINGVVMKSDQLYNADDMDNWTYVVGYCNGLVCLAGFHGGVVLWNPCTRKSSRLRGYGIAHTVFGFGYDEMKDDYKVFTLIGDKKVSVYSSNSDCWRMIGDFPFAKVSFETCRGQFAYGALHWVVSEEDMYKGIIFSLDINTETYREIMQPVFGKDGYDLTLGTLGNSLSVLCQDKSGADIWVIMKEHGVEESWTKLFTFPIPDYIPYKPRIRPIFRFVNGDFMMLTDLTLILVNTKDEIRMLFDTWENPLYNIFQEFNVYTYVESLVSPPNLNAVEGPPQI